MFLLCSDFLAKLRTTSKKLLKNCRQSMNKP